MTEENMDVMCGEQINLRVKCGNEAVGDVEWSIQEHAFKDYVMTLDEGKLTNLGATDLTSNPITFYWLPTNSAKLVSATFSAGGSSHSASAAFLVHNPVVTIYKPQSIGQWVTIPPQHQQITLYTLTSAGANPGIFFCAIVETPEPFTPGEWYYMQMVEDMTFWLHKDSIVGTSCARNTTSAPLLDSKLIAAGPWGAPHPPTSGSSSGPCILSTTDSPTWLVNTSQGFVQSSRDEDWAMYIMFKPAGANSKAVPVTFLPWHGSYCATSDGEGGPWTIVSKSAEYDEWIDVYAPNQVPVWVDVVPPYENWQNATCPAPCN